MIYKCIYICASFIENLRKSVIHIVFMLKMYDSGTCVLANEKRPFIFSNCRYMMLRISGEIHKVIL